MTILQSDRNKAMENCNGDCDNCPAMPEVVVTIEHKGDKEPHQVEGESFIGVSISSESNRLAVNVMKVGSFSIAQLIAYKDSFDQAIRIILKDLLTKEDNK